MKTSYSTLVELISHVAGTSDKGIQFIEGNDKEVFYSYQDIYAKALLVAGFLQSHGLRKGDELVFQLKDNKDFIVIFWACLLTGIVPIPLAMGVSEEQKLKLMNVWEILNKPTLIIARADAGRIKLSLPAEHMLFTDDMYSSNEAAVLNQPAADDLAFVQFSSGSTGTPKGVMLTHRNLLTNIDAIHRGIHSPAEGDSFFSWMPLTHDMGLIGFHLTPLFKGWTHYIMPTDLFIRNPLLWLKKVTEHRISFTSSPNFGYRYVLKHFKADNYKLDLSSLRVIVNGAEPISAALCEEFTEQMSHYGMGRNTIFPVYGLAEASLAVAFSKIEDPVIAFNAHRKHLGVGSEVCPADDEVNAVSIVEVGTAIHNCAFKIAGNDNEALPDGTIGNILISGGNVTAGYYNNPKATRETITADGWLKTGDLGFVKDGRLYITGRSKDVLFVNGQNFYSHDIERCAEQVDGIELGKVVATGFFDERTQKERIVLFLLHKGDTAAFIPRILALKKHLNAVLGFEVDEVLPVREIKKTTSGKIQRYLFAEGYKNGQYAQVQQEIAALLDAQQVVFSQPETEMEQQLWQIWKDVLGHEQFGIHESFFEVGGNSLRAAEMAARVAGEWAVELRYELMFENPTIALLAKEIAALPQLQRKPLQKAEAREYYPLSAAQQRLFYTWEMDRNAIGYNNPQALKISGAVNAERLQAAFSQMISRHEILRTHFVVRNATPFQLIKETIDFSLQFATVDEQSINGYLKSLVQPFNLLESPLFRASLISTDVASYLFIDFHHIIADGLSIYLFAEELFRLYNGEALQPLQWQYRDYVAWQASADNPAHEAFWLEHLGDDIPLLNLPTETRPPVLTYHGEKRRIGVSKELVAKLKAFSKEQHVSLYMLMLGIYNIFLSKLSGKEDLVVGVPVAGRYRQEFGGMMGMFVNNFAVRSKPAGSKTFSDFMQEIRQLCFETFAHQEYEFSQLLEKTSRDRDVSRNPVFDTMLLYQNMGFPAINAGGLLVSRHFFDPGFSKYDISLEVFEEKDSLEFYLEYNTALFKPDVIDRFAAHLTGLMANVLAHPGEKIASLSVLTAAEEREYLVAFNDTAHQYPAVASIIELFERAVAASPGAIAVRDGQTATSYSALKNKSDELARTLTAKGIGSGDIVAIVMERSTELVTAILAVLKTGAAFLPIDDELPEERINFLIADSRAALVITKEGMQSSNGGSGAGAGDLAYVIYTSGTTGKPKGVMVGQQALINYACWAAATYFAGEKVNIPLYTSISFDLTITSIFPPLISGGTIVVYNDDENNLAIEKVLRDDQVDVMKLTPSHLKILKSDVSTQRNLRKLVVGGEDLSTQLANEITQKFNGRIEIFNEYGPTEATVGCMIYKFDAVKDRGKSVPVGVPISNAAIYVLDAYLRPVPVGVEGDMYIGGRCLANGYLFRDELTAQKFVDNPFKPGEKMYCTGDRARRLPDGNLDFLGRVDSQVKINGHRIELPEIEAQLKLHESIDDAVVIDRTDDNNNKYLCAYVVGAAGKLVNTITLREHLQHRLPAYMIPAYFVVLDQIPLTKNGKVEAGKLPLPNKTAQQESALPSNEIEQLLVEIWRQVLNVSSIGIHDNFFHAGGDSIKAMQIASRLREAGYQAGIKDIMRYQDIETLARHVVAAGKKQYEQGKVTGQFALTPIANWFIAQEFSNPHHFNQSVLLKFNQHIDKELAQHAFEAIIQQHDGLRINYDPVKNQLFYNEKHLAAGFTVAVENGPLPEIGARLKGSFKIEDELLIKAAIINKNYLLITAHHLVIDGVSWRILLEDLYNFYKSVAAVNQKTASLIDWHKAIESFSTREAVAFEKQYWSGIPQPATPAAGTMLDLRTMKIELHDEVITKHNVSVETILLTALLKAYYEVYGADTMNIEMEHHGRSLDNIDLSRTIGWFTALFPVSFTLAGETIGEQLASVREQVNSIRNNGIGYGIIHHFINKEKPVPAGIRFNYLGQFELEKFADVFEVSEQESGPEIGMSNHLTAGIEVLGMVQRNKLSAVINYNVNEEDTVVALAGALKENVAAIFTSLENNGNTAFTPLEFETAGLSQQELDSLFD
jgi:amino acid adenylation domain-containing protein/non-ribosomal peptide synthase protein (TIGR01720 family)